MKSLLKRGGFTIVELTIVIAVIGILAAIIVVVYNGVQDRAYNSKIQNAASHWADAFELYMAKSGTLPTAPSSSNRWGCLGTAANYPAITNYSAGECYHSSDPSSSWTVSAASGTMNGLTAANIDVPSDLFDSGTTQPTSPDARPLRGIAVNVGATGIVQLYYVLKGSNQQCVGKNVWTFSANGFTNCYQTLDTSAVTH